MIMRHNIDLNVNIIYSAGIMSISYETMYSAGIELHNEHSDSSKRTEQLISNLWTCKSI